MILILGLGVALIVSGILTDVISRLTRPPKDIRRADQYHFRLIRGRVQDRRAQLMSLRENARKRKN